MSTLSVTTITTENSTTPLRLQTGNNTTAFIKLEANNVLSMGTSSIENFRIDTSGDVGIGTSNPNATGWGKALTLNGPSGQNGAYELNYNGTLIGFLSYSTGPYNLNIGNATANAMTFFTGGSERMRVDASGNVGIGTSTITTPTGFNRFLAIGDADTGVGQISDGVLGFSTNGLTRARFDTGGNFLVGTTTTTALLNYGSNFNAGVAGSYPGLAGHGSYGGGICFNDTAIAGIYAQSSGAELVFFTGQTASDTAASKAKMKITSGGHLLIGETTDISSASSTATGVELFQDGTVYAYAADTSPLSLGRQNSDGNIVTFWQGGVNEGAISVSGTTVTYGAFSGSHWSQLSDNSRPDILVGTVVETIDEKCQWPGQENDQLAKFKISDTPGSKRVYGVFMAWDNDDLENNDAHITSLGAYLVRIAAGVTVQGGDLLESNGDGCARVQDDDIIRSKTIGKVTSNIPTHTYEDGSYTVPCVLYCG